MLLFVLCLTYHSLLFLAPLFQKTWNKILEYLTLPWQVLKVQEVVTVTRTLLEKSTKYFFPIFNFKIGFSNHFLCSLSNCFICSHTRPFKTWPLLLSSNVLATSFLYILFHNYVPAVWNHLWFSPVCFLKLFSSSGTLSIGVFPWIFSSQLSPFEDFPDNFSPQKEKLGVLPF